MGLRDFFKKGKEEPVKAPVQPKAPVAQPAAAAPTPAPQQPAAAPAASNDTYTVQSGDSLSKIAKNLYGNAADWKKIYEANKATIGSNPDLIKPGQKFIIPR